VGLLGLDGHAAFAQLLYQVFVLDDVGREGFDRSAICGGLLGLELSADLETDLITGDRNLGDVAVLDSTVKSRLIKLAQ